MQRAIVVLGAPNDGHGRLSAVALARANCAYGEYRRLDEARFLLTGGYGEHFNSTSSPHAHYLREHLVGLGVPGSAFLELVESANTLEDARLSKPVLDRHEIRHASVVTSDFHVPRARYVFERLCTGVALHFVACPSKLPEEQISRLHDHERRALARARRMLEG